MSRTKVYPGVDLSHSPLKKNSLFLKKHIRNAKELEKKQKKEIIYQQVNSWLGADQAKVDRATVKQLLKCLRQLITLMGFRYNKKLILPTFIYVDRFIQKHGHIEYKNLFNILLVSALVTLKFWEEDSGVDMNLTSYVSGIPVKEITALERDFLGKIDYSLFLSPTDVEQWTKNVRISAIPTTTAVC